MKKLLTLFLLVLLMTGMSLSAQKPRQTAIKQRTNIKTEGDSLSYAYGVGTAKQGLMSYLMQKGILADTERVTSDYNSRIASAELHTEKSRLNRELKAKLDSMKVANDSNLKGFLIGVNESISSGKNNSAYMTGVEIGNQLSNMGENFFKQSLQGSYGDVNLQLVVKGIEDVISNKPLEIEDAEVLVENKFGAIKAKQDELKKKDYVAAIEAGEKFMAENKNRNGVITLPSGLQYQVVKEGRGEKPSLSDRVKVHYHGMLTDGSIFDSSVDRGEPITLGVGDVIKGWTEALQLMPVGSKWILYIPYELGYGSESAGKIPPFSPLVFEVELLDIEK